MSISSSECQSESIKIRQEFTLTYLEFYSGVGGWSFALQEACQNVNRDSEHKNNHIHSLAKFKFSTKCLGAYDHSDLCYKVFNHNFPEIGYSGSPKYSSSSSDGAKQEQRKKKQKINSSWQTPISIEKLTTNELEKMKADIWMMSPPCQPHTRQHCNQKEDVNDPRSKSFLHLCDVISSMNQESLPKMILLENVIGFENVSFAITR